MFFTIMGTLVCTKVTYYVVDDQLKKDTGRIRTSVVPAPFNP